MDGSTVPVIMEIKRMPIITVDDDTTMNRLQVGTVPAGKDNWMEFTPSIRDCGYQSCCSMF